MTPTPKSASGATGLHAAEQPQGAAGPFVLNLCSSTTPMALSNPEQPELKRFSFFVSRRFEEGRERFRLHMGYFSTLAEAQEWLGAVRDIYPGAWAGEAPGKKLRERAVAAAAAQAQHAAGPPPTLNVPTIHAAGGGSAVVSDPALASSAIGAVPALSATRTAPVSSVTSAGHATPKAAAPAPAARPLVASGASSAPAAAAMSPPLAKPAPVASSAQAAAVPASAAAAAFAAKAALAPARVPTARPTAAPKVTPVAEMLGKPRTNTPPQARPSTVPTSAAFTGAASTPNSRPPAARSLATPTSARTNPAAVPVAHAAPPAKQASRNAKTNLPNSNVREVLKALEETPAGAEITGETRMMPAPVLANLNALSGDDSLTDTQVLKYLEARRPDGMELAGDIETGAISLLKPDDTGTRRALKEAIAENAPVWFAVQLQWSVQPVQLSRVPPLAIFSAYTLYTVEGSRDGRKWYGLRLGFFSDAISAKQVAYYVRSEFTSVAVVPVSPQERDRASDSDKKAELAFPKKARSGPVDEFKLIDSDETPPSRNAAPTKSAKPAKAVPAVAARRPPGAAAPKANNGRVRARDSRAPQTLEETLEILGAGELEMDNGTGETMNESGVRHLRVEVQKNTPFGRLLERLSERVRKP